MKVSRRKGLVVTALALLLSIFVVGCNTYQHGKNDIEYALKYEYTGWKEIHLTRDVTVVKSMAEFEALSESSGFNAAYSPDFFTATNKALVFIRFHYSSSDVDVNDKEFGIKLCCLRADSSDGTLAKVIFDIKGTKSGLYDEDIHEKIFVFEIDRKYLSETKEIKIAVHNLNSNKYGSYFYPLDSKS